MVKLRERLAVLQGTTRTVAPITVPFGPWLPDLPDFANPGAILATNVTPAELSYRPFPSFTPLSDPIGERGRGMISVQDDSGSTFVYAGDRTKLYLMDLPTPVDKSKVGGYSTGEEENWQFTRFGSNLLATNFADAVQTIPIGGAGLFSDLFTSTEKPKAKYIAVVGRFLVIGNVVDSSGTIPYRVRWSGIGDPTDMDPNATTQSDFEDLVDGGAIAGIVGGAEYGVIFQDRRISRMTYVGSPTVFRIDPVDRQRGTLIASSIIGLGRDIFYRSEEGFFRFNGTQSISIGTDRVDRKFANVFDPTYRHRVSVAIDPVNKLVAWAVPGDSASAGQPNQIFIYNWYHDKWSIVETEIQIMGSIQTASTSLDQLGTLIPNIDLFAGSLDDAQFKGGAALFAAFGPLSRLGYFSGPPLNAIIDTGEFQLGNGRRSMVNSLRPLIAGGTVTCQIASRAKLSDPVVFDPAVSPNSIGEYSVRNDGRYHRVRVNISGSWTHAQGVQAFGRETGRK